MRHWRIWLYLVVMGAILISCALVSSPGLITLPAADRTSSTQSPMEVASVTEAPVETAAPAVEPTEEPTEEPAQETTETEVAVVDEGDQCVACHTDKAQLIDTAKPEEEVVEESEGAG